MTAPDVTKPADDPFNLIGSHWPVESEGSYHAAELVSDAAATTSQGQAHSATDARSKMVGEEGKTAESVSDGYDHLSARIHEQAIHFTTISGWMVDAAAVVRTAKTNISDLVSAGTSEIREALDSELKGTPVTPSSSELGDKFRGEIASISSKLTTDLDGIGHSLAGAPGASTTPAYVRTEPTSTAPTIREAAHQEASGQAPEVTPQKLPEMPRASTPSTPESPSAPGAPSSTVTPHPVNPTLAGLISGSGSSGTPASPSAKSPSLASSGTPAGQQQGSQPNETHQDSKTPVLPRIPSITLPGLPAAAESIVTAVSSAATGHQLPTSTATSTPGSSQAPASTGFTPGTSGTAPVLPTPPAGLAPVGGLPTPPVVQAPPASQGAPAAPSPGVQTPSPASPSPAPRGPVADLGWLQRTYGLAPGLDLPKPETTGIPALFIAELPEPEATLHRALASIRHQFEQAGWSQPIAVGLIRRGFETKTVYVTADGLSIHPAGILLPTGVFPLDEMPNGPSAPELLGSLMVSDKLRSLIPRTWEVESMLSTVPGGEGSQSSEQCQELVESGELLDCKRSRGRDDVDVDEALSMFARAAIGSAGCGELDVEAARIRAGRWVGTQPAGYRDVLARWHLSDAADAMSRGAWGEAVYASEKYMSVNQARSQAA
ncbi:hypothetical protein KC238_13230 [Mycobacteroides chelonae]|nr:hypothetical protein [Mycobacteroides chelonae]UJW66091.1 hypothetical protein H0I67_01215 [Mycobacteroides chelonae]